MLLGKNIQKVIQSEIKKQTAFVNAIKNNNANYGTKIETAEIEASIDYMKEILNGGNK